jgi:DNA-binding NarL/FixJ family response regulator
MTDRIVALIIDDHAVVREGISALLNKQDRFTIHHSASIKEGRAFIALHNPDLIIVDINLPDGNGLEIVQWVRLLKPDAAIVVLSLNEEDEYVIGAMKAGASSFVNKSEPLGILMAQIEVALKAPQVFAATSISGALIRKHESFGLSQRELQILSQLHHGESLKEFADSLFIAESTLKKHLSSIYQKLSVRNRIQAIAKAREAGILKQ